jgi:hypothetical protein
VGVLTPPPASSARAEMTALPKVDTNCTAPSLKPTVMVTRFATSPPTDNCPQPKEAQPLSQLDIRLI